ncbi:hypothetical protein T265_04427 [Opisthorchis viverrini]|uniref:Uncharacterized protein n=1 Tax=Opisthorchis viverrini TaxID=6198 RepID=A0A074ZSL7_OPIVI|nr:hypothetical protein T265_04427 [Opisthorchis viverrini]KER28822.1 hypothetical protein T265_04427 [Opisthorchis viverrini]
MFGAQLHRDTDTSALRPCNKWEPDVSTYTAAYSYLTISDEHLFLDPLEACGLNFDVAVSLLYELYGVIQTLMYLYLCEVEVFTDIEYADDIAILDEPIELAGKFVYPGGCTSPGSLAKDDISIRSGKTRAAFVTLHHPRRASYTRLSAEDRVYNTAVRSILLHGLETWPLHAGDVKNLSLIDLRSLSESGGNKSLRWNESGRPDNNLGASSESPYQQNQLCLSLPSPWMGTSGWNTSMFRDIVRHGPIAPSMALCIHAVHSSLPNPPTNRPLTVLYLRTNLSALASNAQLPSPPPKIIGLRNRGSYNRCTLSCLHTDNNKNARLQWIALWYGFCRIQLHSVFFEIKFLADRVLFTAHEKIDLESFLSIGQLVVQRHFLAESEHLLSSRVEAERRCQTGAQKKSE